MRILKQQLQTLAAHPGDPGIAVFRALLKRRAGEAAREIEQKWRNMIFVMPDLLERVRRDASAREEAAARRLYGYLLTYLYCARDIIPEDGNGFFGYVDDAYLVTAAHRRISGTEAIPEAKSWLEAVRTVIPQEAERLDEILEELLLGRTQAYSAAVAS